MYFDFGTNNENTIGTLHYVKFSQTWNIGTCTAIVCLLTYIYIFVTYPHYYKMALVSLIVLQKIYFINDDYLICIYALQL